MRRSATLWRGLSRGLHSSAAAAAPPLGAAPLGSASLGSTMHTPGLHRVRSLIDEQLFGSTAHLTPSRAASSGLLASAPLASAAAPDSLSARSFTTLSGGNALARPPSALSAAAQLEMQISRSFSAQPAAAANRTTTFLTPELAEGAATCIAETFAQQNDPFTWLLNLKRHHWFSLCIPFVERAANASTPLSIVSINNDTGKVDGVMVNEDWTLPRPLAYRVQLSSEWVPVRALFAELHQRFVSAQRAPIERGEVVRCMYFTCVHPTARGQGVMKSLWRGTVDAAREAGYQSIAATASSESVREVLQEHLGFTEQAAVDYASYEVPAADAAQSGYSGRVFSELVERNPKQYSRLSIHKRRVPSNLYV